jgi:2-aminoadipate transaminase
MLANQFESVFANRMNNIPRSFLREILQVAREPGMISFAGGLPNQDLFPTTELRDACNKVFDAFGSDVLQYTSSEGVWELRQYIADHYKKRGTPNIAPENILITNGSQQALDLLGKALIDKDDRVILEEPSYLGAIQALSIFQPHFVTVPLTDRGLEVESLRQALAKGAKLMYLIPNFQNPSGLSYSEENRRAVAEAVIGTNTYLVEDDPYGELRFAGTHKSSFMNLAPKNTVLLGTFSKTIVPGLRLGWIVAPPALMEKLLIAKQAADLHTSPFTQRILHHYLANNDAEAHIAKIVALYSKHQKAMVAAIERHFPKSVAHTTPEGGMFLWATLPNGLSAMRLFEEAAKDRVCIVPGHPFYIGKEDVATLRLSFSCVDEPTIEEGIRRLGKAAHKLCG